jgi:hypothetical protein
VAAEFSAEEIMDLTGARLATGMMPDDAGRIVADTREDVEGAWFVATAGNFYDGHDFLGDAFNGGALGCIVADRPAYPIASTSFPLLAVGSCEDALGELTKNWRKRTLKKLCLVASTGADDALCGDIHQFLTGHRECTLFNWHGSPVDAMVQFLALDDEQDLLLADFAPKPLQQAVWLAGCLLPNLFVMPDGAFDFARIKIDQSAIGAIKLLMSQDLIAQKKPLCTVVTNDYPFAALLKLTPEQRLNPEALPRIAQAMGLS